MPAEVCHGDVEMRELSAGGMTSRRRILSWWSDHSDAVHPDGKRLQRSLVLGLENDESNPRYLTGTDTMKW